MLLSANILQPLIDVFEAVLKFFHNDVGVGWGLSIVLMTVVIRASLLPLTVKQLGSMRRLQMLQPEMKKLQERYKDDKQRQQQEMMKFYKENNVNPLGSCLPLLAQLPVFYSLFFLLRKNLREDMCRSIQHIWQTGGKLKGYDFTVKAHGRGSTIPCVSHGFHAANAGFLFVKDLTNTAHGVVLVVLIVLYVGTQLASTMMMQTPTMDQTQRRLMMFMPLIFVLFILRFPAGVIVYWITTNSWTMAQQYVIRTRIGPPPVAVAAVAADGKGRSATRSGSSGGGSKGRSTGKAVDANGKPADLKKPVDAKSDNAKSDNGKSGNGKAADAATGKTAGANGKTNGRAGNLLRGKKVEDAPEPAGNGKAGAAPPPPPRKKKKRSGKR